MNVGILEAWLKLKDDLTPALKGVAGTLAKTSAGLEKVARDILPVAASLGVIAGASVKFASDFDAAMNESLAILPKFSEAVKKDLGDTAREVALTTTQSAQDAAKSYYFLASAGIATAEALQTALPIAAQFAQAGVMDMANATEILVDSVKSLGLSVDTDMQHVGDVIVKAAVASSASVQQLGDALTNKAATAMRTFGVSIEEGTAVLSVFADQGVKGQIAGERLSILLNGLADAAGKHSKEFKALNIELYDGQGNFKNLQQVTTSVEIALRGMSTQQKIATLETLGLSRETKSAVLQLVGASSEIGRYETAYKSAGGTMKEIADNQMQSFANQTDVLRKKVIDVAISFGDALIPTLLKMIPIIENVIKTVSGFIKTFEGLDSSTKDLLIGFGGLLIALPGILFGLGAIAAASGVMAGGLATLTTATSAAAAAVVGLTLVGAGFVAGGALILYFLAQYVSIQQEAAAATRATALEMDRHKKIIADNTATNQEAATIRHSLNLILANGGTVTSSLRVAIQNLSATTADAIGVKKTLAEMDANAVTNNANLKLAIARTAEETKALHEAMDKASKAAHALGVEQIKLREVQADVAMNSQMVKLDVIMNDAALAAKRLNAEALPISVHVMNAAIAAKQNTIDTKLWNSEVEKIGKTLKLSKEEIDALKKKTDETKKSTTDWGKVVSVVSDVFQTMGVSASSALGKAISGLTAVMSITQETQKLVGTDGSKGFANFLKLDNAKKGEVALQGLNAALVAYKSGALGGAMAGAQFGSSFGPWGAAIGGAIGGLLGLFGAGNKAREEARKLTAEIEKQRTQFIKNAGGLAILQSKAKEVGMTLDAVFNAKTLDAYNAAVDELNAKFEALENANNELTAAMDKYGITVEQLGPKFAQQQLDKQAAQLLKEYELLSAAGVNHTVIISKMGPELQKYVNDSLRAGTAIPENLRPILTEMLNLGLLTDEAGNKLDNLDGITFTESLTEGLTRAIDAIYDLISALTGIPRQINTDINITRRTRNGAGDEESDKGGEEIAMAQGFNGFVNGPTRILVGEAGREHLEVVPDDNWKAREKGGNKSSGGDTYIIFDTTKGTPSLGSAAQARQLTAMMGSGAVKVNSRVLTKKAG